MPVRPEKEGWLGTLAAALSALMILTMLVLAYLAHRGPASSEGDPRWQVEHERLMGPIREEHRRWQQHPEMKRLLREREEARQRGDHEGVHRADQEITIFMNGFPGDTARRGKPREDE